MKSSLAKLSVKADAMALRPIGEFSRHIQDLISNAACPMQLHDQALSALHDCLTLLAWQLELIDARTGQLGLDDSEQIALIASVSQQIPQRGTGYKSEQRLPYAS
jgi:hypothetical protein